MIEIMQLLKDKLSDSRFELTQSYVRGEESKKEEYFNDGKDEAFKEAIEMVNVLQESRTPEIPLFVAREIEFMQRKEKELGCLPDILDTSDLGEDKEWLNYAQKWKESNYMKYCNAYSNGFKVAPTLYTVEDKHGNNLLYKVIDGIGIAVRKGEVVTELSTLEEGSLLLTEKEIKDFDEKYWIFAEPTEELKG